MQADLEEVSRLSDAVKCFCESHALSPRVVYTVNLGLEEVLTNIVKYGYGEGASRRIDVSLTLDDTDLSVIFTDDGMAFNPLAAPPPDLSVRLQDRVVGGLGLHILRKMMDIIDYRREGNKNILRMSVKV